MEIRVSPRGNGACPFCRKEERCIILNRMREALKEVKDPQRSGMEIVVYNCPMFEEKF